METHKLLKNNLKLLDLSTINDIFASESEKAVNESISYIEYLNILVSAEIESKRERSINYKIRNAKFPFIKTLESFDFDFQPCIDEIKIKELSSLGFIEKAENVLFLGPPGVGKTHLAIGIGLKACEQRIRTLFISAEALINELIIADFNKSLQETLEKYTRYPLLIIDELGFLPINKEAANLFFQFVSKKYEKTSVIITSNKSLNKWGEIFNDNVIAAAIVDRLIHHSHIFRVNGKSYRAKEKIESENIEKTK